MADTRKKIYINFQFYIQREINMLNKYILNAAQEKTKKEKILIKRKNIYLPKM